MATKREMLEADDRAWSLFIATVESFPGEQLVEPGYYANEGWSVKDLIAHIAFWMSEAAGKLEEMRLGTYRPESLDTDALNRLCYEVNKDLPAPVVRAECYAAHTRMLQEFDALREFDREAEEWFAESSDAHCREHQPRLDEWAAELRARAGA